MPRAAAVLRLRCPRCREGAIWRAFLTMNERCPVCGLVFEREPGYFTGAMVVSYAIAVPTFGLIVIALMLGGLDAAIALLVGAVLYLALAPFIFRYSRAVWMHFDWLIDPATER
ncbi:MAG TPA: DUF983 domain-containing protein [Candidatus Limnocylindria bacterium]|nr:DUF983 domain-containing protein [Candidatus Limnocylindria bacterium]